MVRILLVFTGLFLVSCSDQPATLSFTGQTMGTTYNIVAIDHSAALDRGQVKAAIDATLDRVNGQLSNWDPNAEISLWNAAKTTEPIKISPALSDVVEMAQIVHADSEGQFDMTLGPLIELWGFGTREFDTPVPSEDAIREALDKTGQDRLITLDTDALTLTKLEPDVTLYIAALAKGYGIDQVAGALEGFGLTDFMVEIGGDLKTAGLNPEGEAWRIGIERPDSMPGAIREIVELSGQGMATSGDYRNYFEVNDVRFSHIIDSETGRPITHKTASVTVISETAALADAWATALLVLGENEGMAIAVELDVAAYFIVRDATSQETEFISASSPRFEALQNIN
ncbi:MAG: FAD:protein FMN transferase [Pseudomonadota bacterium]